jgi:hypothetical protein
MTRGSSSIAIERDHQSEDKEISTSSTCVFRMMDKVERLQAISKEKNAESAHLELEQIFKADVDISTSERESEADLAGVTRALSRRKRRSRVNTIEHAQWCLFEMEKNGRFVQHPLEPESEFPTFLTRIPIFVPARRAHLRELLDDDNAMPFTTSWGEGRKHGPPLTVYDEDTLIAVGKLRQSRLIGRPSKFPIPISGLCETKRVANEDAQVHVVQCMLSDIQAVCKTSRGGKNNKMRLDSLKRLMATTIEFTKTTGEFANVGSGIRLLDIAWDIYEDNAVLYIQFSPVMAMWFDREYTYIDWNVRLTLTDTGKAIHRFLSGQSKKYQIATRKLALTIGYMRDQKRFMEDLRETMAHLVKENWLKKYEIIGTGRSVPYKLVINRE